MLANLSHLVNTDKSYTEYDSVGSTSLNHGVFLLVKSNIPLVCRLCTVRPNVCVLDREHT